MHEQFSRLVFAQGALGKPSMSHSIFLNFLCATMLGLETNSVSLMEKLISYEQCLAQGLFIVLTSHLLAFFISVVEIMAHFFYVCVITVLSCSIGSEFRKKRDNMQVFVNFKLIIRMWE